MQFLKQIRLEVDLTLNFPGLSFSRFDPICPQMSSRRALRNQLLRELALEPSEPICFLAKLFDESESFAVGGFLLSLAIELYNCLHDAVSSQISVEEALLPMEDVLSMVSDVSVFGERATRDLFDSFKGMWTCV